MSTILDALKKVEGERPQSPRDQLLHAPSPGTTRRRPLSIGMVVACAALGFATGIGLALWRNAPPSDVGDLAESEPPANDVAASARPAAAQDVLGAPPAPAAPAAPNAAPAPAAPPPAAAVPPPDVPAPAVAAPAAAGSAPAMPEAVPAAPAPVAPALAMPAGADPGVATSAAAAAGSALEPSPFTPPRPGTPASGTDTRLAHAQNAPPAAAPPPAAETMPAPDAMAALQPAPPESTTATEPEPPPVPPTVIDTGRSPPGAPRVALSFLQWSPDPARRFALVSVDGAPSQRIREGDTAGGMTVEQITPTGVQFKRDANFFTIRPRH